jgi:hypothetical protein
MRCCRVGPVFRRGIVVNADIVLQMEELYLEGKCVVSFFMHDMVCNMLFVTPRVFN